MPDTVPDIQTNSGGITRFIPVIAIIWLVVAGIIFVVGNQEVSLRDEERFPNDIVLEVEETDEENVVIANVISGTFEFQVVPEVSTDIQTGTFTDGSESVVAAELFSNLDYITEVTITEQTTVTEGEGDDATETLQPQQVRIVVVPEDEDGAEGLLNRTTRFVASALILNRDQITSRLADDAENTLIYEPLDPATVLQYGRFVPALLPEGESEAYANDEEGLDGSDLAQLIFEEVGSVNGLEIYPDRLVITYRDGAIANQVVMNVQNTVNDYYPRGSLQPNFWLFSIEGNSDKIMEIIPIDAGFPLVLYALAFAVLELSMALFLRNSDDKLLRPLIRAAGIFLLFWSIYGHEPLWDYLLGIIFPNARQVVHPNGTVVEFTAQHLELVIISSLITIPAGLLIGILVTRESFREVLPLANNLVNSGQTVPTIAIVAIMAPIIGFGFWPAIIALIAYGLLPVVRNTIAGLEGVDDFIIDSARGMGMTPTQILFQIELPIASSIIMAGVRTSMVVNVGTATLGAFVGSGGLGTPIASGLSMSIDAFVLLGAIPAAVLAILVDYILGRVEYVLTPKGLQLDK